MSDHPLEAWGGDRASPAGVLTLMILASVTCWLGWYAYRGELGRLISAAPQIEVELRPQPPASAKLPLPPTLAIESVVIDLTASPPVQPSATVEISLLPPAAEIGIPQVPSVVTQLPPFESPTPAVIPPIAPAPLATAIPPAAASTVAAAGLILLLIFLMLRRRGQRFQASPICRPLIAAVLMTAVLLGLRTGEKLALSVGLGAAVYAAALVLLGGVPEDIKLHLRKHRLDQAQR